MKKRNREKLPHHNVYARLGASSIHGVGVFAIRDIPSGTYVFPDDEEELVWVRRDLLAGLSKEERNLYDDFCIIRGDLYGCPRSFNKLTPTWYFNEYSSPNVAADETYRFYALRDIEKGEELTVDYSDYSDRPDPESVPYKPAVLEHGRANKAGDAIMTDSEKLRFLFDRTQIGEVVHRYPVSIDARDWKLFRSIFTDEIQVYLGPRTQTPRMRTVTADQFTQQVTGIISRFDVTQHFLTDYHFEVAGDNALWVSYMQARHFKQGQTTWDMGGYYTYHLVRAGESWKIPKYTLTVTWEENRPADIRI